MAPARWALLVGVGDYAGQANDLSYPTSDVLKIREAFLHRADTGYTSERIVVLADNSQLRPTRRNILDAAADLARRVQRGDALFVYVSSHGIEIDGQPFLVPADATDAAELSTLLSMQDFLRALAAIPSRDQVLAIDACHSGLSEFVPARTRPWSDGSGRVLKDAARNLFIISSSEVGQVSYEDANLQSGVMAHALLQALYGIAADTDFDGVLSAQEAFNSVRGRVAEWSLATGLTQTPRFYGNANVMPSIMTFDIVEQGSFEAVPTVRYSFTVTEEAAASFRVHVILRVPQDLAAREGEVELRMALAGGHVNLIRRRLVSGLAVQSITLRASDRPVRVELTDGIFDPATKRRIGSIRAISQ